VVSASPGTSRCSCRQSQTASSHSSSRTAGPPSAGQVALGEHQVQHGPDLDQALLQPGAVRQGEGDPAVPDLRSGADQALAHGRLGDEEPGGDLTVVEPHDVPQGQGDLSLRGQRGVAARQHQREQVVVHAGLSRVPLQPVVDRRGRRRSPGFGIGIHGEAVLPQRVQSLAPRCRGQPGAGPVRDTGAGPGDGRGGEGLLHGVLRQPEVAEPARDDRHHARALVPPGPAERLLDRRGRVHGGALRHVAPGTTPDARTVAGSEPAARAGPRWCRCARSAPARPSPVPCPDPGRR
jgi:hypothetical protein